MADPIDNLVIPRRIALMLLDLIGGCLVCVQGVWEHQEVIRALEAALGEDNNPS